MPKKKKVSDAKAYEMDSFDETYKSMTKKKGGKYAKQSGGAGGKIAITVVILVLVCVAVLAGLHFFSGEGNIPLLPANTIPSGVTIAGVDVGGMTKDEAIAELNAQVGSKYDEQTLIVSVLDRQWELTPALTGATLDAEAAVNAAMSTPAGSALDVIPYLNLNTANITTSIEEFSKFFPNVGVESGYEITSADDVQTLVITIGTVYYDFNPDTFYTAVLDMLNNGQFYAEYPCLQMNIAAIDLDEIYAQHCYDPVEAVLDTQTMEVSQSSNGYRFDLDVAKEALESAQPGDVLEFALENVEPQMSTELLKSMLFRDKLGSYTAKNSSSSGRDTNLRLACQSLNGKILLPGETISYNATLGERTAAKGYQPAASYLNGETIYTYGGGICQPSSALYYAALIADLEIVERSNHGFVSAYMPLGMDATVDWSGPDFKFKNNTDYPIRIDATASGGTVTVTLVGTDTKDYYVKMEYEVLSTTAPTVKEEIVDPSSGHRDGEVKTTAYTGYTVQTYKLKYDKDTDKLISREKEAYSYYAKRDKVVYRYKQEEETTPPEETTESTDPSETTQATTQATESTTQATENTTQATTQATESTTQATTQATEATTQATTQATEATTQATTQATESTTQATTQATTSSSEDSGGSSEASE